MMTNLDNLVEKMKQERDRLLRQAEGLSAALVAFGAAYANGAGTKRQISAAGKARIAAAQRARWAKVKGKNGNGALVVTTKKRTMSAAARRKIAAAQRARWAKVKAGK